MLYLFICSIVSSIISYYFGLLPGIIFVLVLFIISQDYKRYQKEKVPNQNLVLNKIIGTEIVSTSENIVGTYSGQNIHEFLMVKNPSQNEIIKYTYDGIIQFNKLGQIIRLPTKDEIFTSWGLIYKKDPIPINPPSENNNGPLDNSTNLESRTD